MVARHVIVRKLDSIEALGAVTDVCSDKTGASIVANLCQQQRETDSSYTNQAL